MQAAAAQYEVGQGTQQAILMAQIERNRLTQRLKTVEFLHSLKGFLIESGVVAFNLIDGEGTPDDLEAIREVFPIVYVFGVPKTRNLIALALTSDEALSLPDMVERARELDAELQVGLSFETMVRGLR